MSKISFSSTMYDDKYMKKYRKKPVTIQAIQVLQPFEVETLKGVMTGKKGDWLVKGIKGELYPVDNKIFKETYEVLKQ